MTFLSLTDLVSQVVRHRLQENFKKNWLERSGDFTKNKNYLLIQEIFFLIFLFFFKLQERTKLSTMLNIFLKEIDNVFLKNQILPSKNHKL